MISHCLVEFQEGYHIYAKNSGNFAKIDEPEGEIIKVNGKLYDDPGLPGKITDIRENSKAKLAATNHGELYCTNIGVYKSETVKNFTKVKIEGELCDILGAQVFSTTTGVYYLYGKSGSIPVTNVDRFVGAIEKPGTSQTTFERILDARKSEWNILKLPDDFGRAIKIVGSMKDQLVMIDRLGRVIIYDRKYRWRLLPKKYGNIHKIRKTILLQQGNDLIVLGSDYILPIQGKIRGVFRHWILTSEYLYYIRGKNISTMSQIIASAVTNKWRECGDILFLSACFPDHGQEFTWIVNENHADTTYDYLL